MPGSWGASPLPRGWARLRRRVLERDGWHCRVPACQQQAGEVDHVVPRSAGGPDTMNNLRAICPQHHREKTLRESGAVTDRRARGAEQHPGMIGQGP